jgi:hypothetical protein
MFPGNTRHLLFHEPRKAQRANHSRQAILTSLSDLVCATLHAIYASLVNECVYEPYEFS